MTKLRIEADAVADLHRIVRHGVDQDLPDPPAFVRQLRKRLELLTTHPEAGRPGRVTGTRELVVSGTPFIAVYRVDRDGVAIIRVLHGAQQWP